MEFILFKEDSKDWNAIWNWLAEHPINKDIENPKFALNQTEVWQYMGSFKKDNKIITEWVHRNHPTTNSYQKLTLSHELISEDSIEIRNKIK